jgi:hypothetical protein
MRFGYKQERKSTIFRSPKSLPLSASNVRPSATPFRLAIYSHVIGDSHRQAVEKLSSVLDVCWPQLATNEIEAEVKGKLIQ